MKKTVLTLLMCILGIVGLVLLGVFDIINKDIVAKITIFLTAIVAFIMSYLTAKKRNKHGLANGMIIGISIALVSLLIHFMLKTYYFDIFFIRGLVFMVSGAFGGVIGVNKTE